MENTQLITVGSIRNGNIYESGIRFAKKKNNYRYATHRD